MLSSCAKVRQTTSRRVDDRRPSSCAVFPSWFGALLAASVYWFRVFASVRGDEPVKPTASASEANPAVPAPGHSVHGEAFNDGPAARGLRHARHGQGPFPGDHQEARAQAFIDQGVAQLHSFYYFEAERSFRQAAKIDPDCAMAYWGMAMANVNNPKRAKEFLKEARKRAASITRREALYLDALEGSTRTAPTTRPSGRTGSRGSRRSSRNSPATSTPAPGWRWSPGKTPCTGIGSRQAVDIVLDTVLQVEPMHPGAHHYRIHLWDGTKPIRAEKSAATYAKTAPGSRTPGTCRATPIPS